MQSKMVVKGYKDNLGILRHAVREDVERMGGSQWRK
jgi:hypothetical protein